MQVPVKLPSDLLIEFSEFCTLIAQAVSPAGEQGLRGIDCIVGKHMDCELGRRSGNVSTELYRGIQPDMFGGKFVHLTLSPESSGLFLSPWDEPQQLTLMDDVLEQGQSQVTRVPLPYPLIDDDYRLLESVSSRLPPLRYPISELEAKTFLEAWCDLPDQPGWRPILVTAAYIERCKAEQVVIRQHHDRVLRKEFASGRLPAVDDRYVPVMALTAGSFIPRDYAITYLERCGLVQVCNIGGFDTQRNDQSAGPWSEKTPVVMRQEIAPGREESVSAAQQATNEQGKERPPRGAANRADKRAPPPFCSGQEMRVVDRVARLPRVKELTGLGRSSIYNRMDPRSPQFDPTFPCSFPLGATSSSAVGWDEEKVKAWIAAQAASGRM